MTELEKVAEILKDIRDPVILELGAHHGNETVAIYDNCLGKPLYIAVEADPRNVPILTRRMMGRGVNIIWAAISYHIGLTNFYPSNDDNKVWASGSIRPPKEHLKFFPNIRFEGAYKTRAMTVDEITNLYNLSKIDLIWSDLQGAEIDMIAGAKEALKITRYVLLEADRIELYEGQGTLYGILDLMLPNFNLIYGWPENANYLFERRI